MKKCKKFTGINRCNDHTTIRTATVVLVGIVVVFWLSVLAVVVMGGVR